MMAPDIERTIARALRNESKVLHQPAIATAQYNLMELTSRRRVDGIPSHIKRIEAALTDDGEGVELIVHYLARPDDTTGTVSLFFDCEVPFDRAVTEGIFSAIVSMLNAGGRLR